jgi:hypothetical protein
MPVLPEPSEQSAGSPLYTYAFLPMPDAPLWHFIQQTQGIRGPLQVFSPTGGRIAAAVEPMPDPASLQASDEVLLRSALRHDQVICRLFAQMPLLPLRFGTCFLSAEKLGSHLLAQQAEYEQALAAIGGRAEYCLKGKLSPQPPPGSPTRSQRHSLSVGPQTSLSPATTGPRAARTGAGGPAAALAFYLASAKRGSAAGRSPAALLLAHPCRTGNGSPARPNLGSSTPPLAIGLERVPAPLSLCGCPAGSLQMYSVVP